MYLLENKLFNSLNNATTTFITALLLFSFFAACSTGPGPIEEYGKELKEVHVNAIIKANDKLVFATANGVFIYKNNLFYEAGLQEYIIGDIVQTGNEEFLAGGYKPPFNHGEKTLFKTTNGGQSWQLHMGDYGGSRNITEVFLLAVHPQDKSILFARNAGNVSRSFNGGKTWESVFGTWDYFMGDVALLKIDPRNPNVIWAGGAGVTGYAQLAKSTDGGDSWKDIQIRERSYRSFSVKAIAIHLNDSKKVIIGTTQGLKKSTDGGKNWHPFPINMAGYTFTRSARSAETLYASGVNAKGTLFFAVTCDFGQTWQMVNIANSPADIHVHDIVSVIENGREVLYFGTSKGVYSYTVEK